jgi:hypothetical protein
LLLRCTLLLQPSLCLLLGLLLGDNSLNRGNALSLCEAFHLRMCGFVCLRVSLDSRLRTWTSVSNRFRQK